MLNGVGRERGKKKTTTIQHPFFYISLSQLSQRETSLQHVLWRKCCMSSQKILFALLLVLLFAFILHCRSFLARWLLSFLIFSPPVQNFHVVLPTKFVSFVFYLSLFFSVLELLQPVAYFSRFLYLCLCLYSKFVEMTINLSLILQTTRIQKQFLLFILPLLGAVTNTMVDHGKRHFPR